VEYLQESEASMDRRRRQRRTTLTLTIVAALMLGTFVYAAAYYQGWVGYRTAAKPLASPSCQRATPDQALTPSGVTVNVYNATGRAGLAASVAKSLRTQGFKIANVANDPLSKPIDGIGEVRRGQTGTAGATLAAARLPGAKLVRDSRTDASVDVVLGTKFSALSAPPKVAPPKPGTAVPC